MPETLAQSYFPVVVQIALAFGVAFALVAAGLLLGKKVKNRVKDMPYECGMVPQGNARERFSVKFYLVAMLFILFDIEAIFLYPWAMVYRELKMFAFVEMMLFVAVVMIGFYYVYKKGALDWTRDETKLEHVPPKSDVSAWLEETAVK